MERQLDSTGGDVSEAQDRRAWAFACCCRSRPRRCSATGTWKDCASASRRGTGSRSGGDRGGHPAQCRAGRKAGLEVRRGIVVNDYMETSDPDIFAVGECTEHRGQTFGLVAPLMEQGKVLAATITGNRGPVFTGATPAAKLKIMGVEIFSAGSIDEAEPGVETVRYEDPCAGRLQEAAAEKQPAARRDSGGRHLGRAALHGMAARGDRSRARSAGICCSRRRSRSRPGSGRNAGQRNRSAAATASARATIIEAIHEHGITTLSQLKDLHARLHQLRKLHRALPAIAARRRAGIRGGDAEPRCAPACRSPTSSCATSCAAQQLKSVQEVLERLRQPQGLRSLQAGAELHAGHAVVRRA